MSSALLLFGAPKQTREECKEFSLKVKIVARYLSISICSFSDPGYIYVLMFLSIFNVEHVLIQTIS